MCYLVCERAGLNNPSSEYLAGYLRENERIPAISLDRVMKAAGLIEEMAQKKLPLRKASRGKSSKTVRPSLISSEKMERQYDDMMKDRKPPKAPKTPGPSRCRTS